MGLKSRGSSTPVQSKITNLETQLKALDKLAGVETSISDLKNQVADIKSGLENAVGQDEIDSINKELEKVQAELEKLLNQQSFTQGPINLRNQAELRYVKTLGEINNVRGGVTVDISSKSMLDSLEAINKITSKIVTIIGGSLTTTGHVSEMHKKTESKSTPTLSTCRALPSKATKG